MRGARIAAAGLALLACAACSKRDTGAPAPVAIDAGQALDARTMAFLSEARALHHEANLKEQADDARGAAATVERIVRAPRPHAGERIPEVEEVLADAFARIAELDLRAGDPVAAAKAAKEGLTHAPEPTYFRGHLLEVEGIAEEARAASLADAGSARGAAEARAGSMRLLEEAVAVQERVIVEALDAGTDTPSKGAPP